MSVLFPKVNKPREWDYRPIYYDKEKEARKEKLARLQHGGNRFTDDDSSETGHHLHRGSFREQHEKNLSQQQRAAHTSKLIFWIALLAMLLVAFYVVL